MIKLKFNEAKATQAAALLLKLRGARMSYLKLIKLLYVVDRNALLRWARPVTTTATCQRIEAPAEPDFESDHR